MRVSVFDYTCKRAFVYIRECVHASLRAFVCSCLFV